MKTLKLILGVALSCFALDHANAQQAVQVTFENLQPADGFYLTPVFAGFHDGSFDVFDAGTAASASLEAVAEDGMFAGLQADFTATVLASKAFSPALVDSQALRFSIPVSQFLKFSLSIRTRDS